MYKPYGLICLCILAASIPSLVVAQEVVRASENGDEVCVDFFAPSWKVTAETLWLARGSRFPTAESRVPTGAAIDQGFAGDRFQPGLRISLQRIDQDCNGWELSYFGLQRWAENETVFGDPAGLTSLVTSPNLRFDDVIGAFDTSVAFSYRAQTHNAEINRWFAYAHDESWKIDWLIGGRFFNFEERLAATGIDARFGTETLDSAAFNSLFGAQVGGRIERTWNRLSLFGSGKAGVYGNNWSYRVQDTVVPTVGAPPPAINLIQNGLGIAGLLETQTGFRYQLTNRLACTGGYTVLYAPGVALQPTFSGVDRRPSSGLLLHGASVGFDFSW